MWLSRKQTLLTGCLLLLSVNVSFASLCHSTAPGFIAGNADYFALYTGDVADEGTLMSNPDFAREQVMRLRDMEKGVERIARDLKGRWYGTVTETVCKGRQQALRKVTRHLDVEAQIKQSFSGALALEAEKSKDRRVTLERVELTPGLRTRRVRSNGQVTFSRVEVRSDNEFSYIEKSRVDGNTGVRLVHQIRALELVGNELRIERDIYINGFFAAREEWLLERT